MLGFVQQGCVILCNVEDGSIRPLTSPGQQEPSGDAVVFSPDGHYLAWMQESDGFRQLFMAETGL